MRFELPNMCWILRNFFKCCIERLITYSNVDHNSTFKCKFIPLRITQTEIVPVGKQLTYLLLFFCLKCFFLFEFRELFSVNFVSFNGDMLTNCNLH